MNLTLKNVPENLYEGLKRAAAEQGRSLNAQIIRILASESGELERRRKMRESRKELEQFVRSLRKMRSSVPLIREDRDR